MTPAQLKNILQSNVLSVGVLNDDVLEEGFLHIEAGSHVLLAPACAKCDEADEEKLEKVFEMVADRAFVAGQIKPSAHGLTECGGTSAYDEYYASVLKQADFLDKMGVSLIFLTDFTEILEIKCALYAIREATALPVCAGFSQIADEEGVKKALSFLNTLQAAEVSAVGVTGLDIEDGLELLSCIQDFATVPLFAICEAGDYLIREDYEDYIPSFVNQKCAMIGLSDKGAGFSAAAVKAMWQLSPLSPEFPVIYAVSSINETLFLDFNGKVVSNHKQLLEIKTEEENEIKQALSLFNKPGAAPVCFNIRDIDVLRYAIMHYAGRPAVRSDEYGEILAKELGAFIFQEKSENSADA